MMDTFNKALLLNQRFFNDLRDSPHVVQQGLMIVLLVGLVVGGVKGMQIFLASDPYPGMALSLEQGDEFFEQMLINATDPQQRESLVEFRDNLQILSETYEAVIALPTPLPGPVAAAAWGLGKMASQPFNYLATLLMLVIFTHIAATRLGGSGTIQQMLGLGALATAPLALEALTIIPAISIIISLAAYFWSLMVLILATSVAHRIDAGRATLAVLFFPVLSIILFVCGYCGLIVLGISLGAGLAS